MDPNVIHSTMMTLVHKLLVTLEENVPASEIDDTALELANEVHELDGWLRSGGFLPKAWQR